MNPSFLSTAQRLLLPALLASISLFSAAAAAADDDGIAAVVKRATYLGSKTELLIETAAVATGPGETLKLWTGSLVPPGETLRFRVAQEKWILL